MLLTWMQIWCWTNQFSRSPCRANCKEQHQGHTYSCNKEQSWTFRVPEPDSHHCRRGNYLDLGVHSDSSSRNSRYRNDLVKNVNDRAMCSWMWSFRVQEAHGVDRTSRIGIVTAHTWPMVKIRMDGFRVHHHPSAAIDCWLQLLWHFIRQRTHMSVSNCQQQRPTTSHGCWDLRPGHSILTTLDPLLRHK